MPKELSKDELELVEIVKDGKQAQKLLGDCYKIMWNIRSSMSQTIYGNQIHGLCNEMDKYFRELNAKREKYIQSEKL